MICSIVYPQGRWWECCTAGNTDHVVQEYGQQERILPVVSSKKVAKSSAVTEEGEGGDGGIRSEEKMLWSL